MKPKLISFYSDVDGGTYYSQHGKYLIAACNRLNISHEIVELPSLGSYMLNCLRKPKFIKDMMEKHKCDLIWMDCETELRESFNAFDNITHDIGFASHTGNIEGIKASPVYFKHGEKFNFIIDSWIDACENGLKQNGFELDHDALKHAVIPKIHTQISIFIIENNFNDYCDGRYIMNKNSHAKGKAEVHRKMAQINRGRPAL